MPPLPGLLVGATPRIGEVMAQAEEAAFPEDAGARIVFVLVGVGIVGLYLILRRTRRRTEAAYWERRRREQAQRDADPDMKQDD